MTKKRFIQYLGKQFLKSVYWGYYRKVFPDFQLELEKKIGNCDSLLDVGCGSSSPIKKFSKKFYCVGADAFLPSINKSKKQKIHNKYHRVNILELEKKFNPKSFDCVIALDLIEHLPKKDGLKLIKMMERIARKKVIIFTPNGFLPQEEYDNNPWQVHKSGWDVSEMKKRGYKIVGINGWKRLRGEYADLKFKSRLWIIVSDISQLFVKNSPEYAFQILCTKYLE